MHVHTDSLDSDKKKAGKMCFIEPTMTHTKKKSAVKN